MVYKSNSSVNTKKFAAALARTLVRRRSSVVSPKSALVIALNGDLGAGKTTFTQGFLRGLGIRKRTTSPTFILFRRFRIPVRKGFTFHATRFTNVFHVDAYRIKKPKELLSLGFKEILEDPKNIVLIEWAENVKKILPRGVVVVRFEHGDIANRRSIKLS